MKSTGTWSSIATGFALFAAGLAFSWGPALLTAAVEAPPALAEVRQMLDRRCAVASSPVGAWQPERAAALADGIWASPGQGQCLLKRHDMSLEDFELLMSQIADDQSLSRRYAKARRLGTVL